jgi:hypothetical protein
VQIEDDEVDTRSVNEIAASIDTTLSPEQKAYVAKLRQSIRGGINAPRCKSLLPICIYNDFFKTISVVSRCAPPP